MKLSFPNVNCILFFTKGSESYSLPTNCFFLIKIFTEERKVGSRGMMWIGHESEPAVLLEKSQMQGVFLYWCSCCSWMVHLTCIEDLCKNSKYFCFTIASANVVVFHIWILLNAKWPPSSEATISKKKSWFCLLSLTEAEEDGLKKGKLKKMKQVDIAELCAACGITGMLLYSH